MKVLNMSKTTQAFTSSTGYVLRLKKEFSDFNWFKGDSVTSMFLLYFLLNLFSFHRGNIVSVGGYHKSQRGTCFATKSHVMDIH